MSDPSDCASYKRYLDFNRQFPGIKDEYKLFDRWYFNNQDDLGYPKNKGVYIKSSLYPKLGNYIRNNFLNELKDIHDGLKMPEQMNENELKAMRFINGFKMFHAWRMSLSVYKVDEDIFEEMLKSPIPNDTPSDVFGHLPDFCLYVEFPYLINLETINDRFNQNFNVQVRGFWAYLNYTMDDRSKLELHICTDVVDNPNYPETFSTVSMIIEEGLTVEQSVSLVFEQYKYIRKDEALALAEADNKTLYAFLPILLWLCAEEPDITNMQGEPLTPEQVREPKYSLKKKGQFVPPSSPTVFNLGERLGGKIRDFKDSVSKGDAKSSVKKRPHRRKGHWHGYWYGTGQNKKFKPKWVATTFVNG